MASVLGAVVTATALIWLANTIRTSDVLTVVHDTDSELTFILNAVMAEISEARPTALCLDPDPNTQTAPETSTSSCNEPGENWGYWPTVTSGTRSFVPGSPFHQATPDSVCYFSVPEGTVPDPATEAAPWGACIELSSDGRVLARTLEPESAAKTNYLAAAVASNYDWSSGTWTERVLGTVDSMAFSYTGFDGTDLTPTAGNSVAALDLDEIAIVTVELTLHEADVDNVVADSVYIRSSRYSPCRDTVSAYDTNATPNITTTTAAPPACPSATAPP